MEASPVKGGGHSHISVRKGSVFATRQTASIPQDVESHGFLQLPCRQANPGVHSASALQPT